MSNQIDEKIVLGLDTQKTAAQINTDLQKLRPRLNAVPIRAEMDTDGIRSAAKKAASVFKKHLSDAANGLTQWLSLGSAVTLFVSKTKAAVRELKQVDTLLTDISRSNASLSQADLTRIGDNAFRIAGRYGKTAADYLSGVQEALNAGYRNAEAIAELSLAAQNAGSMTAQFADRMILATDKAYKMNGSVTELTKVLDGMNEITNYHAVTMEELSDGMSAAGDAASSLGLDVAEAASALAAMLAQTGEEGSVTGSALKTILFYTGQITDEQQGIRADALADYEAACLALNVRLRETKNGLLSLRAPMTVLEELSTSYNRLDETDPRRSDLLRSVGGGNTAAQLDALLRGWDTYETMLQQYADGTGSMAKEAERTTDSWEGAMNRLSNTWTDALGNVVNSNAITAAVNSLNGLLTVVERVTDWFGSVGTIGLGAGITAFVKNFA